jgi:hypothetical protein
MLTMTCCLRFSDGQSVSAELNASSRLADAPVSYHGSVERLPVAPVSASEVEIEAYFNSFARELHAQLCLQVDEDPPPNVEGTEFADPAEMLALRKKLKELRTIQEINDFSPVDPCL